MSKVETKLAEIGLSLPVLGAPLNVYVPAVRTGDLVYTSGSLPIIDGQVAATGKVGAEITLDEAGEISKICVLNALAAIKGLIGDLDKVVRVVKVVGFVASDPSFTGQPAVMNVASNLLLSAFGDAGAHARSAVGVAALPLDAPVEVEMIVEVKP